MITHPCSPAGRVHSFHVYAGPHGRSGVDGVVLTQDGNRGGVQVVPVLSPGGGGDIDEQAVHEDLALVRLQFEGCGNLDEHVFCGIIRADHFFVPLTVQLPLGGHAFNRASHPGESSLWKRKSRNDVRDGIEKRAPARC